MVDRELRSVDALLADRRYPRFAARRVAGVDAPERFCEFVRTDNWLPINAIVHVSDLPGIIKSLGGIELYGDRPLVALRELVQNGTDAVRARRLIEGRSDKFGRLTVEVDETRSGESWLVVSDTGVGMSQRVLTDFLLDFGRSFWRSTQMQEEFPGLASKGFRAIGRYGIGFFSVFMIADQVKVVTRRPDAAARETLVLEFGAGIAGRPILRAARADEQVLDAGTVVRIRLVRPPFEKKGIFFDERTKPTRSLVDICRSLCPSLDVDLFVKDANGEALAVGAGDWINVPGVELVSRLRPIEIEVGTEEMKAFQAKAGECLTIITEADGTIVGRAAITIGFASSDYMRHADHEGVVTVGGLAACGLSGICGVLVGEVQRASRDAAKPIVSDRALRQWASEQVRVIPKLWDTPVEQAACAAYIRLCGGDTGELPIAINQGRWVSAAKIRDMKLTDEVLLVDHLTMRSRMEVVGGEFELESNVFITAISGLPGLLQTRGSVRWPRNVNTAFAASSGTPALTLGGAVAEAICDAWGIDARLVARATRLDERRSFRVGTLLGKDLLLAAVQLLRPGSELASIQGDVELAEELEDESQDPEDVINDDDY
jgi:hypothetical protein